MEHAKWISRRLQRSLGFFNVPASQLPSRPRTQISSATFPSCGRLQKLHVAIRNPSAGRASVKRTSLPGRTPNTNIAADAGSAYTHGREFSLSFEHGMDADAEAQDDYHTLRDKTYFESFQCSSNFA